jgi:hypothetical protein
MSLFLTFVIAAVVLLIVGKAFHMRRIQIRVGMWVRLKSMDNDVRARDWYVAEVEKDRLFVQAIMSSASGLWVPRSKVKRVLR